MIRLLTQSEFLSQFGQDLEAYLYLKLKKKGFFVDIGAYDGIESSNTYFFENLAEGGWNGVLIEPNPEVFEKLKQNRNSDSYNVALSNIEDDNAEFIKISGYGEQYSGLYPGMTDFGKQRIEKECTNDRSTIEYIKVKTVTFDKIMENYPGIRYIDFMSIDVEGGEMNILRTIDFNKYKFGIITIEMGTPGIQEYMIKNGYKFYKQKGCDFMYIPK